MNRAASGGSRFREILRGLLVFFLVLLLGIILIERFSWPAPVSHFAKHDLPKVRGYWKLARLYFPLVRNSDVCSTIDAFNGFGEALALDRALRLMADRAKPGVVTDSGIRPWQTPFGEMWFPGSAEAWTVNFALAQFQNAAYPGLLVKKGDVAMDCGGYVGDWTKWTVRAGASKVITVEPALMQLECIRRNLAAEISEGRVKIHAKGVWDREDLLVLRLNAQNPAANTVSGQTANGGESIELTTIDKIVADEKLDRLDVLKMDIEGAEVRAIRGARETLNRFRPRLAIATEHTSDVLQNNRNVILAVREVAPFYHVRCGICEVRSGTLTPLTLYFTPEGK
jgi:FkbM family methyltransferase